MSLPFGVLVWKEKKKMLNGGACDNAVMHASKSERYVSAFLCFNQKLDSCIGPLKLQKQKKKKAQ